LIKLNLLNRLAFFLVAVSLVQEPLYFAPLYNLLGDDFLAVLRLDPDIEGFFRQYFNNRPLLTEAETAGLDDLYLILNALLFSLADKPFINFNAFVGFTRGTAATKDIVVI
jgi:hypothetical protein